VARLLDEEDEERERLLAALAREDAARASRVRSRLAALASFGLDLDELAGAPPRRCGPYRLQSRIGGGGMGEVHLAVDAQGRRVAVKLVRPDRLVFDGGSERFAREVRAVSDLNHPAIVTLLDSGEDEGIPWLATEWVGGASLAEIVEHLRHRPPESLGPEDFADAVVACADERPDAENARAGAFPGSTWPEVIAHVCARVAEGLTHAHDAGVIHRDVKPANVLVTPAGRVLLVDFGLALPRGVERMTRTGSWLGSLPYASPEQLEGGSRPIDARTDLYSLGATLHELLTLRTPFLGGRESDVRKRISTGLLDGCRKLNPRVPRALARIARAAMDLDPRRRYLDARDLAADLQRAAASQPVRARRPPIWLRALRAVRGHPRLSTACAVAAVLVLGSLGFAVRERIHAQRIRRLADGELLVRLEQEASGFWLPDLGGVERMERWLVRAEGLARRGDTHRRSLDTLRPRALPYSAVQRESDRIDSVLQLATLALELEGLANLMDGKDRTLVTLPPSPERSAALWASTREALEERPIEAVSELRERVAVIRKRMSSRADHWRSDLQQLPDLEHVIDRMAPRLTERRTWSFDDEVDQWRHDALATLVGSLAGLARLTDDVRGQLDASIQMREAFESSRAWPRAIEAVARSPRYGGLTLEPVFGLEPLGPDPTSGLWQFLFIPSGTPPGADDPDRLSMSEDAGIVLVLLPGSRYRMGNRPDEAAATPGRFGLPLHDVELAPFFISKYELTLGQALRMADSLPNNQPQPESRRHPAAIDYKPGRALLARYGLELPTEAQWEYAARGNRLLEPFEGYVNALDHTRIEAFEAEGTPSYNKATFRDGYYRAAPVGTFRPNAFGLHDMLGNVAEWCRDGFVTRGYTTLLSRPGDGLKGSVLTPYYYACRGGSYSDGAESLHAGRRTHHAPVNVASIGLRPVLNLDAR